MMSRIFPLAEHYIQQQEEVTSQNMNISSEDLYNGSHATNRRYQVQQWEVFEKDYFSHRMIWGNEGTGTSLYVYES